MQTHLTHHDYVQACQRRAVEIATGIVTGSIPLLDGCHRLAALGHRVGVADDDPDFRMFSLIESETDALPIGPIRKEWAPDALCAETGRGVGVPLLPTGRRPSAVAVAVDAVCACYTRRDSPAPASDQAAPHTKTVTL
ncbi:hypothetical protein ACM9XC_15390 [Xanthomonas sacchari]